jgi:hypothetical protein
MHQFWELPESTEDVFSLFSPADIRRTRDNNLANLETLILAVTSRLIVLRNHPSFPDPELAPERDALNCIRVLTRLLPFLYEADHLETWEDQFFWAARRKRSRRGQLVRSEIIFDEADPEQTPTEKEPHAEFEKAKPLAEEIIDTLIDLLFYSEFTLPKVTAGKNKVTYAIWQSGVGCNTPVASTKEFESNRTEILRLLLTLASKSMYMSAGILPVKGVKAITYIATCPDKQVVLSVLCSLLNTVSAPLCYHAHVLTRADTEIQPRNLARAIRPRSVQGPETDTRHILPTAATRTHIVPHTRSWQRQRPSTEELLPPLPWPLAPATRLSVPC